MLVVSFRGLWAVVPGGHLELVVPLREVGWESFSFKKLGNMLYINKL